MNIKKIFTPFAILVLLQFLTGRAVSQWGSAVQELVSGRPVEEWTLQNALGIDNAGNLHIIYSDRGSCFEPVTCYTMKPAGGDWWPGKVIVDSAGRGISNLAVDQRRCRAYISFDRNDSLTLAAGNYGRWDYTYLPAPGTDYIYKSSVAVDDSGNVHVAVVVMIGANFHMGYGIYDPTSGGYDFQVVEGSQFWNLLPDTDLELCVKSRGAAVVVFNAGQDLIIVENGEHGGRNWSIDNIFITDWRCALPSLKRNSNDDLFMAFFADSGYMFERDAWIYFTSKPVGMSFWLAPIRVSFTIQGVHPKLAVEDNGTSHIVFADYTNTWVVGRLYYSTNRSGLWQTGVLLEAPRLLHSFILGPQGNGSVCYYYATTPANRDIYYYGFTALQTPPLGIQLEPAGAPVQIPPGGGSLEFTAFLTNNTSNPIPFDVWTEVRLPNGNTFSPLILRFDMNIQAGQSMNRIVIQSVPGYAPAGRYVYIGKTGVYSDLVISGEGFSLEKSAGADNGGWFDNWTVSGWDVKAGSSQQSAVGIFMCSPNPFNQKTVASFELRDASKVKLAVYDVTGREAAVLAEGWYPAGMHRAEFNGTELASGVYFAVLETESRRETVKLLLLK